jgi:DHA2 family multidrug resistance protein
MAIFPPEKRGTALAIWSVTALVGPVAGPILGGYISDNYHWGWIFLINVPIGLIAATLTWRALRDHDTPTFKIPLNLIGIALLVFWVGALQTVLDLGKNEDWFHSTFIVATAILSAIGFAAWIIWELTDKRPAVDLHLFAGRNFALGTVAFCLGYAVFFGNTLLLPLWLQQHLGYTATWAGLVAAPSGLVAVIFTPIAARLSVRMDARWLASFSFLAYALSYYMRAGYTAQADYVSLMLPMAVQGMGMSSFFVAMVTISLDGIPPDKVPSATGLSNFARITAGSFAASLTTTLWDRREALHQSRLAELQTPFAESYRATAGALGDLGLDGTRAAAMIAHEMAGQAYLLSSVDIFAASAWLSVVMVPLVWLTHKPAPPTGPVAAD